MCARRVSCAQLFLKSTSKETRAGQDALTEQVRTTHATLASVAFSTQLRVLTCQTRAPSSAGAPS